MKLLFLSQVLPYPLDAGPKVRAYYTLRHLSQRHAVTLAAFVRPGDPPAALNHLRTLCQRVVTVPMPRAPWREAVALARSLALGQPLLITRDHVPAMHAALAELTRHECFDAIHADQLWMAPYALSAADSAAAFGTRPRLVLDQHNAVFLIPQRMAVGARGPLARALLRREARLLAHYEATACRAFDHVVTVTTHDREALLGQGAGPMPPSVIPIGVDPEAVAPNSPPAAGSHVLFLGGMHWPPNADGARWFARQVWPRVQARLPQAEFWAVGKAPPAELTTALAAAHGVRAPGYVANLDAHWARANVLVVPLRAGGGMRVKILDAWLRGLPVVSTTVGAEGLAAAAGDNLLLADTPEALADAVAAVLSNPDLAQRLAQGGRETIVRHYDWRVVYPQWDTVYAKG